MRPLVRAFDVSKAFGPIHVLKDARFQIMEGDKVALVGANGSGKTTLFRLVAGLLRPDLGEVETAPDLRIAYLPQVPDVPPETPVATLLAAPTAGVRDLEAEAAALEAWMASPGAWDGPDAKERMDRYAEIQARLAEERARTSAVGSPLLNDLGVPEEVLDAKFGTLSGGERSKVLLVKALAAAKHAHLLLLDEPTNHMDIPTVEFIEDYLLDLPGAVVVSAHDEYLLDNIAFKVLEVEARRVHAYEGNYTDYVEQKQAMHRALEAKRRRDFAEVQHELRVIENIKKRNRYAMVTARRKNIARVEGQMTSAPVKSKAFRLLFEADRVPAQVLSVKGVSKAFGEITLFRGVEFEVAGGDKLGLIGPNGCGKTTLLKVLAGAIPPDAGSVQRPSSVKIGYFDQHHETLDPSRTLLDEVRSLRDPPPPDDWARGLLGRFQFSGEAVFQKVGTLSGGERARLALAKFIADRHNLLVLDEPTNHLDLASQGIVAAALREYEGSVVVVSHDRSFLDRVCNRIAVIAHRRVGVFPGNFSSARTTKAMAEFAARGVKGRYKVWKAFRDWERDARYHQGDVIEVTGLETQSFRRLLRWAEDEGRIEKVG